MLDSWNRSQLKLQTMCQQSGYEARWSVFNLYRAGCICLLLVKKAPTIQREPMLSFTEGEFACFVLFVWVFHPARECLPMLGINDHGSMEQCVH